MRILRHFEPGDGVGNRGGCFGAAGVSNKIKLAVTVHVSGDETMGAEDDVVHETKLPGLPGERIVRAFQPEDGVVGTDKVGISVAIDIHQTAVDAGGAHLVASLAIAESVNRLAFPVGTLIEDDLALK